MGERELGEEREAAIHIRRRGAFEVEEKEGFIARAWNSELSFVLAFGFVNILGYLDISPSLANRCLERCLV